MFHNHENLAPVQKFNYLKGYIFWVRHVIRSTPTTGENYLQSYNTLMNQYDHKSVIMKSHISLHRQKFKEVTPSRHF